jgi:hypothetical protein
MADDDQRVSLNPLRPIEALKALLKVDPFESKPVEPKKGKAAADSDSKPEKS